MGHKKRRAAPVAGRHPAVHGRHRPRRGAGQRGTWRVARAELPNRTLVKASEGLILGFYDEGAKEISLQRGQGQEELLDTIIHEGLHALCPKWSEAQVEDSAHFLSDLVWGLGYRRKK